LNTQNINKWIKNNKIQKIPKKEKDKIELFNYIANLTFEKNVQYTEKEINEKLKNFYIDYAILRRYMVDYKILSRTRDCKIYWY
jgi:transcriptional regulator